MTNTNENEIQFWKERYAFYYQNYLEESEKGRNDLASMWFNECSECESILNELGVYL